MENQQEQEVISAVKEFAKSISSHRKVVTSMDALVDATNKLPLSNLDYWERLIRTEFDRALNDRVKANWMFWPKPSQFLTWLDLISWDGYKREKTLRTLSGAAPNSFFLTLIIRRLNDWVPQVREAAREVIPSIMKDSDPRHVVDAFCITLPNWNSWGRTEELDKSVFFEIVSKESVAHTLKNRIISSTSGPMAYLLTQVGRTSILDPYLLEIAEKAIQPSVRAKAYRSQFECRIAWFEGKKWEWKDIRYCQKHQITIIGERTIKPLISFKELLEKSASDPSSIVRRVAAEFLIKNLRNLDEDATHYANSFASDKSRAVFERGEFALKMLKESI